MVNLNWRSTDRDRDRASKAEAPSSPIANQSLRQSISPRIRTPSCSLTGSILHSRLHEMR
jgi:hypothetical protein